MRGESHVVDCAEGARGGVLRGPARLLFGLGIDPNRATASTLESLPGIGPGRAAAIVAARADRPFRSIADLSRVPGIGPVSIGRIAASLQLEPAAPAPGVGNR